MRLRKPNLRVHQCLEAKNQDKLEIGGDGGDETRLVEDKDDLAVGPEHGAGAVERLPRLLLRQIARLHLKPFNTFAIGRSKLGSK